MSGFFPSVNNVTKVGAEGAQLGSLNNGEIQENNFGVRSVTAGGINLNSFNGLPDRRLDIDQVGHTVIDQGANNRAPVAPLAPARVTMQSHTARSTVNIAMSRAEQDDIGGKFALLEAKLRETGTIALGEKLARVIPGLNTIVIRIDANTTRTVYAEELPADEQAAFEELKLAYFEKRPGTPSLRLSFQAGRNGALNGGSPFNTRSSQSFSPSAQAFLTDRFPALSAGMSEERKIQVRRNIELAEVMLVKKMKGYERLIASVTAKIANTANLQEKEQLQRDLQQLQQELKKLKQVDPHALYWLLAFSPRNSQDEQACKRQAEGLKQALSTATGNEEFATNVAGLLIHGRENYFRYCSENRIEMRNTGPTQEILDAVRTGALISLAINPPQSAYVRGELEALETNLNQAGNVVVQQANARAASSQKLAAAAVALKDQRVEKYLQLISNLKLIDENNPMIALLERRVNVLTSITQEDILRLSPYYVEVPSNAPNDDPGRIEQREKISQLRAEAQNEGLSPQEIEALVVKLKNGNYRVLLRDAQSIMPNTDPASFAAIAVQRWPEALDPVVKNRLQVIEAEVCVEVQRTLFPSLRAV